MPRPLCAQCFTEGFCRYLRVRLVTDAEIANPEFVRDVRAHAFSMGRTRDGWLEFLADAYRDYPGSVVDENGQPVFLDMSVFEFPAVAYWFRDFANTPCPPEVTPHVREEAWERVRVFATILKLLDPWPARMWGVRAANCEPHRGAAPLAQGIGPRAPCPNVLLRLYGINDDDLDDEDAEA